MEWYDAKQTSRHDECCDDMENWQFYRSVIDGEELRLEGLNIWDHPWKASGETILVNDPIYQQSHRMNVYKLPKGP
ncbi:hypothetical protein GCM10023149_33010 [Mucilaginibacter gynuensis]|uniref:Uncharacterized protein n=1 Tax=Mucilaginibacter gynuensis TaxID=1302236 RepID=A0ABP8GR87_9SPHI